MLILLDYDNLWISRASIIFLKKNFLTYLYILSEKTIILKILKRIIKNKEKVNLFLTSGLNQAISSGTNFLISLYLLNVFSPEFFGLYGICFAFIVFVGGFGNSLFLTQMVVIYPLKRDCDKNLFVLNIFYLILLFCIIFCIITFIFLGIRLIFSFYVEMTNVSILLVVLASITFLLKEFCVRTAYNNRKENIAVYIHAVILLIIVLLYTFFRVYNYNITIAIVFFVFSFAYMVGVFVGLYMLKIKFHLTKIKNIKLVFKEIWDGGKWASLTNLVYILRSQAYIIVATITIGTIGVGYMNAARMFITPALLLIPVVSQLAMPRLAFIRENNKISLFKKGNNLILLYLTFILSYCLILVMGYDTLIDNLFNNNYKNLGGLTFLWCIYALMLAIRNGQDIIVQVLQKFKLLTVVNFISAIITLIFSYTLSVILGLVGVLLGLIIGEIFLIIILYFILKKETVKNTSPLCI